VKPAEYMAAALAEASRALGRTHPNPAVGAVLVKRGRIIAAGHHARAGAPHAEAVALARAGAQARGATLYSTLEPCNHHGRTPPCTEAILEAGVVRVVYASADPNPLVNGKGHRRLARAGVEVVAGVLRAEADALNRPFFKAVTTGLPWVTLKAGITLDGKLATRRGESKWITSPASRDRAHHLRDRADAVLVGVGTVLADDPRLTTRLPGGRTAVRVVLDGALRASPDAAVYDTRAGRTIVATLAPAGGVRARRLVARGVEVWSFSGRRARGVPLEPLLRRLAAAGLLQVLVEGGAEVHAAFLESGFADEVALFIAPRLFGHAGLTWSGGLAVGSVGDALTLDPLRAEQVGPDLFIRALLPGLPKP
jgi:diaminohydroxyphosphoribosylaminopyrimidine deaminase/5-amino-6-(5-phosphoribosylamino)uracil reductase